MHLRRLYVDSNRLGEGGDEALPADLGLLPALELFSASDNGLTSVPESLAQCRTLCRLLLADNRLKRLPAGIQVPDVVVVVWDANAVMRSTLIGSCTPTPTPLRIDRLPIHSRYTPLIDTYRYFTFIDATTKHRALCIVSARTIFQLQYRNAKKKGIREADFCF